jgi:hypothetical protein
LGKETDKSALDVPLIRAAGSVHDVYSAIDTFSPEYLRGTLLSPFPARPSREGIWILEWLSSLRGARGFTVSPFKRPRLWAFVHHLRRILVISCGAHETIYGGDMWKVPTTERDERGSADPSNCTFRRTAVGKCDFHRDYGHYDIHYPDFSESMLFFAVEAP